MSQSLDLFLLPIFRQNNRDLDQIPGLLAAQAPRHAGRGRSNEILLIHLFLEGTAPLSHKGFDKLLAHLSEVYFKTSGSSTTAMGTVITWLNQYLLERNRRGAERNMRAIGKVTLAVLRGGRLNLAHSGSPHTYIVTSRGLSLLYDEGSSDRGLGFGQTANIRYHLMDISPGDLVLLAPDPPPIWTKPVLIGLRGLTLQVAYERLIDGIGPQLQAALIQFKDGPGGLHLEKPQISSIGPMIQRTDSPPNPAMVSTSGLVISKEKEPSAAEIPHHPAVVHDQETSAERAFSKDEALSQDLTGTRESPPESKKIRRNFPAYLPSARKRSTAKPIKRTEPKHTREPWLGPALLKIGKAIALTLKRFWHLLSQMLKRMLPDSSIPSISTSTMALIAVAVPVLVVAIAATVYIKRGRGSLYEQYYLQAQSAAEAAIQLSEPSEIREAWNIVLNHLDQAEEYRITDDSQAIRDYAITVLDDLDLIVRLPFQPALATTLPMDASIHRIVVTEGDSVIYLLNQTDGHVYRGTLTDQGYVIDKDFICEPVPAPLIVGPLVDILPLPLESEDKATVMGLDGNGNLMRCIPGGSAPYAFQMPPPDMHWGTPLAFDSTTLGLYVLDPMTNAVWIFWTNDDFGERPTLFFDEQIPPMGDVIDLALNRDELYLLHQDGHLTTCTFGYPTRCEDPALITDLRNGLESTPTIDNAIFQEIQLTSPPDSSIFLLEPTKPSIYRFTLRLNYHKQYRPLEPLTKGSATAFTVSSGHQVFLAIGNKVFVALLP